MRFRDWVSAIAGFVAVAVSVFVIGGVLRSTQAIVALLVAVALGASWVSRRGFTRLSPLSALLGLATGLTGLQLVPLPHAVLDILAPTQNALREDGASLLHVAPAQTLTTDVPATLGALAFFVILLGLAQIALRMSTTEKGRYRIVAAIAGMCGLVALTVGIHELLGLRALYGLYEPQHAQPIIMGPILNGNSLACLMAAGAMLGIGLAAYRRQPGWLRVVWLLVVAGCGAISLAQPTPASTPADGGASLPMTNSRTGSGPGGAMR